MLSKDLKLNPDTVRECYDELGESLTDRKEFLHNLMLERLDKVNALAIKDFKTCLDEMVLKAEKETTTVKQMNKMIKKLNKVSSRIHKAEIVLFNVLSEE